MAENINTDPPGSDQGFNYDFLQNLEAIQANTDALNTMIPKQFAALSKTIVDVYAKAGQPSRGTAARSVPSISGYSSLSGTTDASARAQLAGNDPTEEEVQGGGSGNLMGGATWQQRVRQGGIGQILPMPRFPGAAPNANDLLNYASTVSANIAQSRQNTLGNRAAAKQAGVVQDLIDNKQISIDDDGNMMSGVNPKISLTPDAQAEFEGQIADAGETPETKLGKISDAFSGLENAYAQGKYIKGILGKVLTPAANTRSYAYESGYQGGQPTVLGMRLPFDGGVIQGLGQRASQMGFSMANNVTPGQSAEIYNNMFSRGWYGGGSTNDMRAAAAGMMRTNPMIGSSPEYYDMMDKATRQGATSLEQFNSVMKQIPDAAKAAHTSISDTMAQMDALGSYNTSIGGTYMQGQQNALAWQQSTGLPSAVMQQLMQNPMVIGQTYAATGLMPQMQGLASPYQHMQGIMGSLNLLNRAIIAPHNKSYKDPITGLTQTISGEDQKEALLSQQLGIPKDIVHTMLSNQKGMLAGASMLNAGQTYSAAITQDVQHGRNAASDFTSGYKGIQSNMKIAVDSQGHHIFENWKDFNKLSKEGSYDWKTDKFKPKMTAAEAHQAAQLSARREVENAGDKDVAKDATKAQLKDAYLKLGINPMTATATQRATVAQDILHGKDGKVSGKMMADVARDRSKEMAHFVNQNTSKFGPGNTTNDGPKLQIELGPAAKKMFHLGSPNGAQKANNNAGTASVNLNSYMGGPTASPMPDLDTAGGSSTYNYGSQDDFDSQMGN